MAKLTPKTSKLVFRQNQSGRIRVYHDGVLVAGVTDVTINQGQYGDRARATIELAGVGFRLEQVEEEAILGENIMDCENP
ncbi:hypothetical protein [Pararhizobium gei]|uniref:hypothetical protein n=1 Tax=Pararhizobium gei TaxID=1395951 RepID=UPI0023D98C2C|nr:hypothetical protein [Rhizobium gei]